METTHAYRLTFEEFELDPSAGRLIGRSGPVALTPKSLALLVYLAARSGRLITKQELLDAIWPGVYVADGALKVCVREIRRALDDDARAPRYVETAHRRGYRFIAGSSRAPRDMTTSGRRPARSIPSRRSGTLGAETSTSPTRSLETAR
jgi:DNA-binding winged helix-turn-helix (wHTH) protein